MKKPFYLSLILSLLFATAWSTAAEQESLFKYSSFIGLDGQDKTLGFKLKKPPYDLQSFDSSLIDSPTLPIPSDISNETFADTGGSLEVPAASDSEKSCATPFANQISALRTAQLAIKHPDNNKTLAELKNEHDKNVAKLIMLKGLKQIRAEYVNALASTTTDYAKKITSLKDLKTFLKKQDGDLRVTEKMLIMEKGISHLRDLMEQDPEKMPKNQEDFYNQLVTSCSKTSTTNDESVNEANINLCGALTNPNHKEMIAGFYNVYVKQEPTAEELDSYSKFLRIAAKENSLSSQISANKMLHSEIDRTIASYQTCSSSKSSACNLPPTPLLAAYENYRRALKSDYDIPSLGKSSAAIDGDDSAIQEKIKMADEKVTDLKAFLDDVKTNDRDLIRSLDSAGSYTKIMKNLEDFDKKNKHVPSDFTNLLKSLNCKTELFTGNSADESNQRGFTSCVKNLSDNVLNKSIADLNDAIEKGRTDIASITNSPLWWSGNQRKYAYQKYLDFSTAINEVVAAMENQCNLKDVAKDDSYNLQACGINDFLPPEHARTLSHQVEKVLDGLQISSDHSKDSVGVLCERLRNYGTQPPQSLCAGGYDGQTASGAKSTPDAIAEGGGGKPSAEVQTEKPKPTNSFSSNSRSSGSSNRSSGFTSGDYAKAFAKAISSPTAISTLTSWAQMPTFHGQLDLQLQMAKNQVTAETYQTAWLNYYNQVQLNSWTNFLGSTQGLPLYSGGVYYNFTSK